MEVQVDFLRSPSLKSLMISVYVKHHERKKKRKSHFNVLLIERDKVTRQCPQTTTFEEKGEPKQIRTEVPLLTGLTPYR